jgi:hypothetical protein
MPFSWSPISIGCISDGPFVKSLSDGLAPPLVHAQPNQCVPYDLCSIYWVKKKGLWAKPRIGGTFYYLRSLLTEYRRQMFLYVLVE